MEPLEVLQAVEARQLAVGYEGLTARERIVWLLATMDFEVTLGGTLGYLCNSSGDHLADLPAALGKIGCGEFARIAEELRAAMAGLCPQGNRPSRSQALQAPTEPVNRAMEAFNLAVQQSLEDYGARLDTFIRQEWDTEQRQERTAVEQNRARI